VNGFPDRRYFARIARESGFRAGPLETVFRLAQLLGQISERLGDELLLRGGTALNLLHLELPRLSVDIDLDFVGAADAEQAQQRRQELLADIEALARAAGYEVAQERASYAMAHLRLLYLDADGRQALLRFDVNFLDRVPVLPPAWLAVRHPFGDDLPASMMQTFALPELAAAKTIALVRRTLARDLFDIAMLATLADIDDEPLRSVLVVRGAGYPPPSPADYAPQIVEQVRPVSWRSEALALVHRPVPLSLEAAKERAADFLRRATELAEGHREFLLQLERGELRPDLLPGGELTDRVGANPALLWRLRVGAEALEER
jgi:predicted nucleotidyltransferase component of viral defense system